MKKNIMKKKLALSSQKLRNLGESDLVHVVGGEQTIVPNCSGACTVLRCPQTPDCAF